MKNSPEPGQSLDVKHRTKLAPEDLAILEYLGMSRHASLVHITWVDSHGMSFYAYTYGKPGIEGFIPAGGVGLRNWQTFFELGGSRNASYVSLKQQHFKKVFPRDFVPSNLMSGQG